MSIETFINCLQAPIDALWKTKKDLYFSSNPSHFIKFGKNKREVTFRGMTSHSKLQGVSNNLNQLSKFLFSELFQMIRLILIMLFSILKSPSINSIVLKGKLSPGNYLLDLLELEYVRQTSLSMMES